MHGSTAVAKTASETNLLPMLERSGECELLTRGREDEVTRFLAQRPVHTVMLAGFIRDNGLESPLNRGSFYACRDAAGRLTGVALIGEITSFEARTEAVLAAFAQRARQASKVGVIIGEQEKVEAFWRRYARGGEAPPVICRELLFELRRAAESCEPARGLRTATLDELEAIASVHADMAYQESGLNPLQAEPEAFVRRCARRIEQQRVWVLTEGRRLVFKADIVSETTDVAYLEGIYINPQDRGKGHGFRCLSQLGGTLLEHTKSVCLLANERNGQAQKLYRKCGYQFRGRYDTIFLT